MRYLNINQLLQIDYRRGVGFKMNDPRQGDFIQLLRGSDNIVYGALRLLALRMSQLLLAEISVHAQHRDNEPPNLVARCTPKIKLIPNGIFWAIEFYPCPSEIQTIVPEGGWAHFDSKTLTIDQLLEVADRMGDPLKPHFAQTIELLEYALTEVAEDLAKIWCCETNGASWQHLEFGGFLAGFRPYKDGDPCPEYLAHCDPDGDWEATHETITQ